MKIQWSGSQPYSMYVHLLNDISHTEGCVDLYAVLITRSGRYICATEHNIYVIIMIDTKAKPT